MTSAFPERARTESGVARPTSLSVRTGGAGAFGPGGGTDLAVGWHEDPFGRHEIRWFSQGDPTSLVRDGVAESHDRLDARVPGDGPD